MAYDRALASVFTTSAEFTKENGSTTNDMVKAMSALAMGISI